MIKLVRLGVERDIQDECLLQHFLDQGYTIVAQQEGNSEELADSENVKELDSLTLVELKALASELGIEFNSKVKKDEIIKLIEVNQREE
ncbi:Rho termination factor N-terminal domain-containing protein [Clostridium baratii]|uniref:Rho termination factor N-terminal domain-containing protein n=1 Tax=Clostridium baratii TaxID=1561 RepID=UPI0030D2CE5C